MATDLTGVGEEQTATRRQVLATMGAAGAGAAGLTGASQTAEAGLLFGDCAIKWPDDIDARIDVDGAAPAPNGAMPESGDLLLFIHGWLSEDIFDSIPVDGANQAAAFEQALDELDFEGTTAAVMYDSTTLWGLAKHNADSAAETLAAWLEENAHNYDSIHLAGHSLGTRVALQTLANLESTTVTSTALLGGAVDPDTICSEYKQAIETGVEERVYSYHTDDDAMVCTLYAIREFTSGVGCTGADCSGGWFSDGGELPSNYEDVDLTGTTEGHCNYYKPESMDFDGESAVPEIARRQLPELTDPPAADNPDDEDSDDDQGGGGPGFTLPAVGAALGLSALYTKLRGGEAGNAADSDVSAEQ